MLNGSKDAPHRACRGTGHIDICNICNKTPSLKHCGDHFRRDVAVFACTDTNFGRGEGCGMMGWAPIGTPGHFGGR
jgi:hypothetical protein